MLIYNAAENNCRKIKKLICIQSAGAGIVIYNNKIIAHERQFCPSNTIFGFCIKNTSLHLLHRDIHILTDNTRHYIHFEVVWVVMVNLKCKAYPMYLHSIIITLQNTIDYMTTEKFKMAELFPSKYISRFDWSKNIN